MRLPVTAHTGRPWRVHEVAGDFRVEDVWALPTPGGPDDLANGLLGAVYMAAIKPFRYLGVYPALLRAMGREWRVGGAGRGH
ncbi:hypothetical protein ACLGIH_17245 [Streptomyces sp. HMX87]|uniref:hypothetical protein n=1 Tax=Streptomyces sp. HMX87 TaxID=3390849 RepID=UPI003A8AB13B